MEPIPEYFPEPKKNEDGGGIMHLDELVNLKQLTNSTWDNRHLEPKLPSREEQIKALEGIDVGRLLEILGEEGTRNYLPPIDPYSLPPSNPSSQEEKSGQTEDPDTPPGTEYSE